MDRTDSSHLCELFEVAWGMVAAERRRGKERVDCGVGERGGSATTGSKGERRGWREGVGDGSHLSGMTIVSVGRQEKSRESLLTVRLLRRCPSAPESEARTRFGHRNNSGRRSVRWDENRDSSECVAIRPRTLSYEQE